MGFMAKIEERMILMNRMCAVTGVTDDRQAVISMASDIQNTVARCMGCRNVDACRQWLATHDKANAAPDFCANSVVFNLARNYG